MAYYTKDTKSNHIIFYVHGLSVGDNVRFFIRYKNEEDGGNVIDSVNNYADGSEMERQFEVPQINKTYAVNVQVNNGGWIGPQDATPYVNYTAVADGNDIAFTVRGLLKNDRVWFYGRYEPEDGSGPVIDSEYNYADSPADYPIMERKFYGFQSNQKYAVNVQVNNSGWAKDIPQYVTTSSKISYTIVSSKGPNVTLRVNGLSLWDNVRFHIKYYDKDYGGDIDVVDEWHYADELPMERTFSLPYINTTYKVNVYVNDDTNGLGEKSFATSSLVSYAISYTSYSVTFKITGLSEGDSIWIRCWHNNREYEWYDIDTYESAWDSNDFPTMERTYDLSDANQAYVADIQVNNTGWIGQKNFTTPKSQRPGNWNWSGISKGAKISLSASTWNQFCVRINDFRKYKGLDNRSFTSAVSGQPMYAYQAREAWDAIDGISGHGDMPDYVYSGTVMSANWMIQLQNALNSVK